MTGKELKAWAAQVPDDATIEFNEGAYSERWVPLKHKLVRAQLIIAPTITMDHVCNAEEEST